MQTRADDELRAGVDGGLGLIGGGDGAGAEQESFGPYSFEFFEQVDRSGDGHGDFNDGDAAGDHCVNDGAALGDAFGAKNGNEADAFDDLLLWFRAWENLKKAELVSKSAS